MINGGKNKQFLQQKIAEMSNNMNKAPNSNQSWPVIVNSSLQSSELHKILQMQHRVRVSESTITGSCIFPVSGVAFLVLHMSEVMDTSSSKTPSDLPQSVTDRLEKCLGVHRCPFVVCVSPMFTDDQLRVFCALQRRFLESALEFLVAHNEQECVHIMNTIAKTHCKPTSDVLKARLKSLRLGQLKSDQARDAVFSQLPVSQHERQILQDTLYSIENVSVATERDLLEFTSLDRDSIRAVLHFFRA